MDNHRAALWCWLQHCDKNKKYNFIHIDKHTDTLQSRLGEWLDVFSNVEDMAIDEYLNKSYMTTDNYNCPLFQFDNYLSIFFKKYDYLLNDVFMFTHGEGDNPNFRCVLYEKDVIDFSCYREIFTPIFNNESECILNIDLDYFYNDEYKIKKGPLCIKIEYIKKFFSLVKEYLDSGKISVLTISLSPAGILIGKFLPGIPTFLEKIQYAGQNIPIAIFIWIMIYPMMMKINFQSIKNVGKHPLGIFISSGISWLIKPFLMFGLASLFLKVVLMLLSLQNWHKVL